MDNSRFHMLAFARSGEMHHLRSFLKSLEHPKDVSFIRDNLTGSTALHWAVIHQNVQAVYLLLKADANPNATNMNGVTPIQYAIYQNEKEILSLLLGDSEMCMNKLQMEWEEYIHLARPIKKLEVERILREYSR